MSPSAEPTSGAEVAAHLVPANLLGDDEIIVLAIKPSGWFVLTASLPVALAAAVVAAAAYAVAAYHPGVPEQAILSFSAAVAFARVVLACWQWIGRTYVLTNLRIVSVRGLVNVSVTGAALVDISQVLLSPTLPERMVGAGSIYCIPQPNAADGVMWHTVARPEEVHEIIDQAIRRDRRPKASGLGA